MSRNRSITHPLSSKLRRLAVWSANSAAHSARSDAASSTDTAPRHTRKPVEWNIVEEDSGGADDADDADNADDAVDADDAADAVGNDAVDDSDGEKELLLLTRCVTMATRKRSAAVPAAAIRLVERRQLASPRQTPPCQCHALLHQSIRVTTCRPDLPHVLLPFDLAALCGRCVCFSISPGCRRHAPTRRFIRCGDATGGDRSSAPVPIVVFLLFSVFLFCKFQCGTRHSLPPSHSERRTPHVQHARVQSLHSTTLCYLPWRWYVCMQASSHACVIKSQPTSQPANQPTNNQPTNQPPTRQSRSRRADHSTW